MERFLARQPIFDRKQSVVAYELLFRSGLANLFPQVDGDHATKQVMADSFLLFGIENLTRQGKAFINFTQSLILDGYAELLPPDQTVIEILETMSPEPKVLKALGQLRKKGYTLALDDYIFQPEHRPFLELVDIVKIDFRDIPREKRMALNRGLANRGIKLLAEKVETQEEYQEALDSGFSLFQGYFFAKPILVSRKDLPGLKSHYLQIIKEINAPEISYDSLTDLVGKDVSLSFKLLQYINSAAFSLRNKVTSIKQALALLGEQEVRKWATLVALTDMAGDKPDELLMSSVVRAKYSEQLAASAGMADRAGDLFLMGLFSLLDAITGRPLEEILTELPLQEDLKGALAGKKNELRRILDIVLAQEKGDWRELDRTASAINLSQKDLPDIYVKALLTPSELGL